MAKTKTFRRKILPSPKQKQVQYPQVRSLREIETTALPVTNTTLKIQTKRKELK